MTSFVQKRNRMWTERPEYVRPIRRRSESRLKTYPSATDVRTWCDTVEDRRQHIIELMLKDIEKCGLKLIPFDVLMKMLFAIAHGEQISATTGLLKEGQELISDDGNECVAAQRHQAEEHEIQELIKGTIQNELDVQPTIQTKMQGPGKMVTRIKGLKPGFQVIDDPTTATRISIKPVKEDSLKAVTSKKTAPLQQVPSQKTYRTSATIAITDVVKTKGGDVNPDKYAALEALCKEQKDKIEALTKERDDLKKKLDACLKELENFKKLQTIANPSLPVSCQQEIEALEAEIRIMRSGNPSPEEEAEIIKKEIEILKRYCSKLKDVENENEKLKVELGSRVAIKDSEYEAENSKISTLKDKLKHLEELTQERDTLADKVITLEKRLAQYKDLPDNIEELKNKAKMLDSVMQERDNLSQKVKMMKSMEEELQKFRGKADRVDDLERELRRMSKGDSNSGLELRKSQSRAGSLENELSNVKSEKDAMRKRIDSLKKELDVQKAKATEAEMLRLERDRLQIKLNELSDIQSQSDEMLNKMKVFDNIKAERDMYKQKYEDVLDMECKCELLKAQVDEAKTVSRERDHLQKQVQDLEACICEQEDEIKSLVIQVDDMSRTREETSRLSVTQNQSINSRIKELEKLLHNAEHVIIQKDCHIKCLENELQSQTGCLSVSKNLNRREMDTVEMMRKELETAKEENRRLQDIANKMLQVNGDDHVKRMLKQSECAVKRVVQELGKQYKEWDHIRMQNPKGKLATQQNKCVCRKPSGI
ncbi:myosin heavy chain, clone 203-like [Anthonomus grandis grandis]|uniref:myosin heavy chain, clone 203-like n=1 Tax=Anthonomus grandis grandis TaxID=2921223 RepID=UPI0021662439|nr:myosin heavy chain, clone 203-like [Anthonomus grandis grandis]